jgi:hypothetical protein
MKGMVIIMLKKGLFITIIMVVFGGLIFKANMVNAEEYDAKMVSVNTYENDPITNIKTLGIGKVRFVTKMNKPIETIIENQTTKVEVAVAVKSFKI